MDTYTLYPTRSLTIDDGNGFRVEFPEGTVSSQVEVRAGLLGPIDPQPSSRLMTVDGRMYRIGFASDERILKDVYVQVPWTMDVSSSKHVCRCTTKPQYPDPLPWNPDDDDYSEASNWTEESNVRPHQSGDVVATNTSVLGTFVVGDKL
ncbi:MAG: hypothetical protein ACQEXJ_04930 [Myxococcota bacterium]